MGLVTHVKAQWLGWLGLLVGVTGLGLAWYFYQASREVRDPVFIVYPSRFEIVSAGRIATAPIKVLRSDGTPISADVYAVYFFFWNAGRRSIRPENVLDTLQITLLDSASEILDFKPLITSRPITRITLTRGTGRRTLVVHFAILEQGDGLQGQIIYQGQSTAALRLSGTIEGAHVRTTTITQPMWALIPEVVGALVLLFVAMGLWVLLVQFIFEKMLGRLWARLVAPYPRLRAAGPAIVGGIIVLALLATAVVIAHHQEAANVLGEVPWSLR